MKILTLALMLTSLSFPAFAAEKESAFDRVMKTQTIRCGYNQYAPYFIKDANTGEFSGIFHDIMEELGKNAGLKIEWAEEVGFDGIFTGLADGRYDVWCSGIWPSTSRSRVGTFTSPVFFSTIVSWAKPGEARFKTLADFNKADVRLATIDGAQEDSIARTDFPLAQRISSSASTLFTDNFLKISTGKADVVFAEPSAAMAYAAANPGKLAPLLPEQPLRVFGNTLAVNKGETSLNELLDQGMLELLYSGRIEAILKRHEKYPGSFLRVAKPYEMAK